MYRPHCYGKKEILNIQIGYNLQKNLKDHNYLSLPIINTKYWYEGPIVDP